MPRQPVGGRLPDGSYAKTPNPKRNAGICLPQDVIKSIDKLPQVSSGEWSRSYLVEQVLRNYLGVVADYSEVDLRLIAKGSVVD